MPEFVQNFRGADREPQKNQVGPREELMELGEPPAELLEFREYQRQRRRQRESDKSSDRPRPERATRRNRAASPASVPGSQPGRRRYKILRTAFQIRCSALFAVVPEQGRPCPNRSVCSSPFSCRSVKSRCTSDSVTWIVGWTRSSSSRICSRLRVPSNKSQARNTAPRAGDDISARPGP